MLLHTGKHGQSAGRARGCKALQLLLEGCLQEQDKPHFTLAGPLPEHSNLCVEALPGHAVCPCLQRLGQARRAAKGNLQQQMCHLLLLLKDYLNCQAAVAWLRTLVVQVAELFEKVLDTRLQQNLLKVPGLHKLGDSGTRKRRPDQDYKQYVFAEAIKTKRARTTKDMVVAQNDFGRSTGENFVHQELARYWAELSLSLPQSLHLSVTMDGARLSNPAVDNLVFAVMTADGVGYWLPQQVPWSSLDRVGEKLEFGKVGSFERSSHLVLAISTIVSLALHFLFLGLSTIVLQQSYGTYI